MMVSEKAEQYINNQTARRVLSTAIKDVIDLGKDSGREKKASDIAGKLERVRDGLIGV